MIAALCQMNPTLVVFCHLHFECWFIDRGACGTFTCGMPLAELKIKQACLTDKCAMQYVLLALIMCVHTNISAQCAHVRYSNSLYVIGK